MRWPVTYDARSDTTKRTTSATSSGVHTWPNGLRCVHRADVVDAHRALHQAPAHLGVDEARARRRSRGCRCGAPPWRASTRAPRARPWPCCTARSSRPCARRRARDHHDVAARPRAHRRQHELRARPRRRTRACATTRSISAGSVSATVWPRDAMPALFTRMSTAPKSASTARDHRLARARRRRPTRAYATARRPSCLDLGDGLGRGRVVLAVVDRDVGAVGGEAERDRLADPAAAAGHQRDPSGQLTALAAIAAPRRSRLLVGERGRALLGERRIASVRSPVKLDSTCVRFSRSMPACRLPISSWLHMTSLVMRTPNGLLPTISSAVSQRGRDDLAVGDDAGHEPDAVGFGRVDRGGR